MGDDRWIGWCSASQILAGESICHARFGQQSDKCQVAEAVVVRQRTVRNLSGGAGARYAQHGLVEGNGRQAIACPRLVGERQQGNFVIGWLRVADQRQLATRVASSGAERTVGQLREWVSPRRGVLLGFAQVHSA